MRQSPWFLTLALCGLAACDPGDAGEAGPGLLGRVEAYGAEMEVWNSSTFYYAEKDSMVLYMTRGEDLSCDEVAAALEGNGFGASGDWDPRSTQLPGFCTLTISSGAYSGALDVSVAAGEKTAEVVVSLGCLLDGEWVEDEENDSWTYDGLRWYGNPDGVTVSVEGSDGAEGSWAIDMSEYTGKDPDIIDSEEPGSGAVSGGGSAEWCEAFAETSLFP